MPTPNLQKLATAIIVALTLMPNAAHAYMTAEDVLLNDEFFLPPSARETEDRIARQAVVSAERRTKEQGESFETQHATAPEEIPEQEEFEDEEPAAKETTDVNLSSTDLELLRTLRLLDRITERQHVLQYGAVQQPGATHMGAPLAPTGAGAWIAATTMLGAVGWTMRRARRTKAWSA